MKRSIGLLLTILVAACGESDPGQPAATATMSGVVSASTGTVIQGASVKVGSRTATTGADGRFEMQNLPVGSATVATSAPLHEPRSQTVTLVAGANTHDVVLTRQPTATVSGVVTAAAGSVITGPIAGATVRIGTRTATTGADGRFQIQDVPVGSVTITAEAVGFAPQSVNATVAAAGSTHDVVLAPTGEWGTRASLLEPFSELAFAEANGKLYLLGGYPASRQTTRTIQVYDVATNSWSLGPQLPQPNNHGMAATVNGRIYLIGGQTSDMSEVGHVNTVWELDPARGTWVAKTPMPTARSSGVAVVHNGKIYVAGGRPPREQDFAVYDPATDSWEVLPLLPTPRNHMTGAAMNGRIHIVGGRQGHGLGYAKVTVHEVFDPVARTWSTAAPMLRARSGMNGVMAHGCFHVWGGEGQEGMFADHDYYDPRTNQWKSLPGMPIPVHGVYGSAFVGGLVWASGGGTNVGGNFGSLHNQVFRPNVSCQ